MFLSVVFLLVVLLVSFNGIVADIARLRQLVASGASDAEISMYMRAPLVQQSAPNFTAKALMPNKEFKDISLSEYKGKYVVLLFYPLGIYKDMW